VASALLPELSAKSKAIEIYSSSDKEDVISMNEFHMIRNFFIQKRQYGWCVVQDILHMDMDDAHIRHSHASILANEFANRYYGFQYDSFYI